MFSVHTLGLIPMVWLSSTKKGSQIYKNTTLCDMVNMKVGCQVTTLLAHWLRVQSMSMNCNKKVHINMKNSPICNGPFDGNMQALRVYNQMVMRSYPSSTSGIRGSCHTWFFAVITKLPKAQNDSQGPPLLLLIKGTELGQMEKKGPKLSESRLEKPERGTEIKCVGTHSLVTLLNPKLY